MAEPEDKNPDFVECANCGGEFYCGDMVGDHCQDCEEELFGGE